eukprot:CAMPEP_0202103550 /NCGR_PEP_ID=MMETSP0965-20130614/4956_1 /ASSEMBLY_ACC=CAM_ASM_000507 /TAXON_ID=4773 /ORGANISM="Schizochytrium aggregatum, Strain ATCC28209" /LENGTH=264 /DNA_ID=CAMNT_0048672357 /DNA_START=49 /DNA_END=843 /DNA_ORIENTATION=-
MILRFLVTCPPYKALYYEPRIAVSNLTVPINYRPPSERGKGIPLTPNVYNADPSIPLYMNWYKVSRETAQFKQCKGAATVHECQCSGISETSPDPHSTDCMRVVETTLFSQYFVPRFFVRTSRNTESSPLQSIYHLRDVNGRKDWCTNATGFELSQCGDSDSIESFGLDPLKHDAILFVGEGLYHFEVSVQDKVSFCELKTHLVIFVLEPPLSTRNESITISVTAISMLLIAFVAYLAYFSCNRASQTEHDFNVGSAGLTSGHG